MEHGLGIAQSSVRDAPDSAATGHGTVADTASPEVSVVIVAWRALEDVVGCLRSLERYAGISYEAVVVDDGSGDSTPRTIQEQFPEATLVAKLRNEGLVAGRNSALPLVTGRFVLMLDADTELRPGALEAMARVLDERPEVGLVGPKLVSPEGEVQPSCRRYPGLLYPLRRRGPLALGGETASTRHYWMTDYDHETERPVVSVLGAAQMWRADLPSLVGQYDSRVSSYGGEDLDWCHRVWSAGMEVRYVPSAVVMHRWQRVTRRAPYSRKSFRQLRDFYYLQWKHRRLRRDPRLAAANA